MAYRKTTVTSLFGKVVYERAYYHCRECGQGHFPTDGEFGLENRQTSAAEELVALAGVLEPFEESAERVLTKMAGLSVSASTVQRTSETAGNDVAARRMAGETIGPERDWEWHRDATGKRVAYVSLDATGVRQQGPRGQKADGRMPWVGAVFNPQPTHQRHRSRRVWETRYVSGLMSLEEVGQQLRRECRAVGVAEADVVIGVTDGGNGLENCLVETLGGLAQEIVFILDFYHAAEHLREFAQVLAPGEEECQTRMAAWCHLLKHRGGRALLQELEALDLPAAAAPVREAHRLLTGYLRSNLHRTDYPTYLARGWQIGSGMIESACKSVVGSRLKGPGMRWGEFGTTSLCQLRALFKSQSSLWDAYWGRSLCT